MVNYDNVVRIPAGCTAIVAFKYGNQLYVANAGDSRGVLCRDGNVAYALSEDHKPQQVRNLCSRWLLIYLAVSAENGDGSYPECRRIRECGGSHQWKSESLTLVR